jgi:outer membrane protein assembly factor BamB
VWTVDFATEKRAGENDLLGSWASDQVVVRGQENGVVAYRIATGEIAWRLPADGVHFCGMSSTISAGVGILIFGGPHPNIPGDLLCNQVRAVDLATGQPRWSVASEPPHPLVKGELAGRHRPEIGGDVVVVDTGGDQIDLDLSTGARRWVFDGIKNNPIGRSQRPGPCVSGTKAVAATRILLERSCTPEAFALGGTTVITSIDPVTGTKQWDLIDSAEQVPQEPTVRVAGGEPPVLFLDRSTSKNGPSSVLPLDPATGKPARELPLPGHPSEYYADFVDRAPRALSEGGTFLAAVDGPHGRQCLDVEGLHLVDLTTGIARWPESMMTSCGMSLIGVTEGSAIVLSSEHPGERPALLRIEMRNDTFEQIALGPRNPTTREDFPSGNVHVIGSTLLVLPIRSHQQRHAVTAIAIPE